MNVEYNTQKEPIILKEYGRNIQNLVAYICKEPDKKKRNQLVDSLMELIGRLASMPKESAEKSQRIWDDLHIISNFKLDVDSPYPAPKRETLSKRPEKVEYPENKTYSRYGKNIDKLITRILAIEDPAEREKGVIYLGRLLNTFLSNWSRNAVDNATIMKSIEQISKGKLSMDLDKVEKDNLFEKLYQEKRKRRNQPGQQSQRKDKRRYTGIGRKRA